MIICPDFFFLSQPVHVYFFSFSVMFYMYQDFQIFVTHSHKDFTMQIIKYLILANVAHHSLTLHLILFLYIFVDKIYLNLNTIAFIVVLWIICKTKQGLCRKEEACISVNDC